MNTSTKHYSSFYAALIKLRHSFIKLIAKVIDPLTPPGAILWFAGVDFSNRYLEVAKELASGSILDVGSGGQSALSLKGFDVTSIDIVCQNGDVDVIASASHLPFKENTFGNVVSVDAIEHIPNNLREQTLRELRRVASEKVVIHCPLQRNNDFQARNCDLSLQEWLTGVHKTSYHFTDEHVNNVEPDPELFLNSGFRVRGVSNAYLWLKCMALNFLHPKLPALCRLLAWSNFLLYKSENVNPPYWGAICTYVKSRVNP